MGSYCTGYTLPRHYFKNLARDGLWSKWKGSSCIFFPSFLLSYLCFLKKNDDRQLHSMSKWPWLWNKFTQIGAPWAQKVVDAINFSVPQIQFHFCFNSVCCTKLRFDKKNLIQGKCTDSISLLCTVPKELQIYVISVVEFQRWWVLEA